MHFYVVGSNQGVQRFFGAISKEAKHHGFATDGRVISRFPPYKVTIGMTASMEDPTEVQVLFESVQRDFDFSKVVNLQGIFFTEPDKKLIETVLNRAGGDTPFVIFRRNRQIVDCVRVLQNKASDPIPAEEESVQVKPADLSQSDLRPNEPSRTLFSIFKQVVLGEREGSSSALDHADRVSLK